MSDTEELFLDQSDDFSFDPSDIDTFDLGIADLRKEPGIQYPAVLLSGVLFVDCLKVLQGLKRKSYREMDVWVELEDDNKFQHIGTLQMDSEILLVLRHLRIRVTMYYSAENIEVLDLEDPEVLEKFI